MHYYFLIIHHENNQHNLNIVKAFTKSKINVMGHIGFTPQFKNTFRVEGKNKKQVKKLHNLDISFEEMFMEQHLLLAKKVQENSDIQFSFADATELLTQQFLALRRIANDTDVSFIGAVDAQQRKQLKGLENLEKRLLRAEKRKHFLLINRIKSLQDQLLPNKSLEERQRNFSEYYLAHGHDLIIALKESLKPLEQAFTILEL